VYSRETLVLLKHLLESGQPKSAIARELGISRRLVYHWIATGQVERDTSAPVPRQRVTAPAKLAPFQPLLEARLAEFPALSSVRLLAECRAAGYTGGYSQLTALVRRLRPQPTPEPVVRFETAPGVQAQFDFAEFRFPWGKRYAVLIVLGYSRLLAVEWVSRQTARTVMAALERAFAVFGGVPREILFDQMKAVIVEDHRGTDGRLLENAEFARFAAHWGFRIRACRPYRARTKGKVERPVHYLRDNLVYGRTFLGDGDLAAQTVAWLDTVANVRRHGTTREAPQLRFTRDEQATLQPLASQPYRGLVPVAPVAAPVSVRVRTPVTVERRRLAAYADLVAEVG
jgi:transposase